MTVVSPFRLLIVAVAAVMVVSLSGCGGETSAYTDKGEPVGSFRTAVDEFAAQLSAGQRESIEESASSTHPKHFLDSLIYLYRGRPVSVDSYGTESEYDLPPLVTFLVDCLDSEDRQFNVAFVREGGVWRPILGYEEQATPTNAVSPTAGPPPGSVEDPPTDRFPRCAGA